MNIVASEVGVDVSKGHLDVSVDGAKSFRIANTQEDCQALVSRLPQGSVVHLESSGGYERTVRRVLSEAGIRVETHDPLKVRRMAQAGSKKVRPRKAKTDPIDAKNLAEVGATLPAAVDKSLGRQGLCDHSRAIDETRAVAAQFLVRARACELDDIAKQAYTQVAAQLNRIAEELEAQFVDRVERSKLATRYRLALSVPGVGPRLARVATCELPEDLTHCSTAQAASYAGLAPIDHSSGARIGKARIGRGNSRIKAACYMPAICAIRFQAWAKELYAKLRAKGCHHQHAVVAVMRRILVRVAAVIRRGTPWQKATLST
jgi:transposase